MLSAANDGIAIVLSLMASIAATYARRLFRTQM